jgi:hypothetical protein
MFILLHENHPCTMYGKSLSVVDKRRYSSLRYWNICSQFQPCIIDRMQNVLDWQWQVFNYTLILFSAYLIVSRNHETRLLCPEMCGYRNRSKCIAGHVGYINNHGSDRLILFGPLRSKVYDLYTVYMAYMYISIFNKLAYIY